MYIKTQLVLNQYSHIVESETNSQIVTLLNCILSRSI